MRESKSMVEMTLRGFLLSTILTVLFTAANIYLGLKVGLTFATSIPAAVISMAVLKMFKNSNILENNIVQTITSSAVSIAAIVFILPALVMIGVWHNFPFWQTTFLCAIGGTLGVMFTIPLRRTLVVESKLPYPEGTAAAEVLKLGENSESFKQKETPIRDISVSSLVAFLFGLISDGFKFVSSSFSYYGKLGSIFTGVGLNYAFSLIGAGYLIGIRIGIAILIGMIVSWVIAVPILAGHHLPLHMSASSYVLSIWASKVRFIGAGTIGIAAVWSILKLLKPVYKGIQSSFNTMLQKSSGMQQQIPLHERDIPIVWVIVISALLIFPLIALFSYFLFANDAAFPASLTITLVIVGAFLAMFVGFIVAAVSGEMAGLVGSSNSPISGIGIIAIILISLIFAYIFHSSGHAVSTIKTDTIIGLVVFVTSAVFAMTCISNDNLQDLKTGHLIGATPWKQQVALIFGTIVGSLVVAPILNQLYQAYGFAGALPHAGMDKLSALAAPQATLMTALAKGIIGSHMNWTMLLLGVVIGLIFIIINESFLEKSTGFNISVLSIGFGIYLPPEINIPLIIGTLVSYFIKRKSRNLDKTVAERIARRGVLFACGFIVGDSLFGIINAFVITVSGSQHPLQLISYHSRWLPNILGTLIFVAGCIYYYRYAIKQK